MCGFALEQPGFKHWSYFPILNLLVTDLPTAKQRSGNLDTPDIKLIVSSKILNIVQELTRIIFHPIDVSTGGDVKLL